MHPRQSGWTLLLSIALWIPTARHALDGDIDLIPALVRYLAALAVASVAVMAVTRLTDGYRVAGAAAASAPAEAPALDPKAHDDVLDATSVLDAVSTLEVGDPTG